MVGPASIVAWKRYVWTRKIRRGPKLFVPFRLAPTGQRQLRLTCLVLCSVFPLREASLYVSWCCTVADDEGVILYPFRYNHEAFPSPGAPSLYPRLLVPTLLLCRVAICVSSGGIDLSRRTRGPCFIFLTHAHAPNQQVDALSFNASGMLVMCMSCLS